jgi:putative hydrolase of the HAD superfamily
MNNTQVVSFDMDDTLYLERDFVKSGFLAVAQYIDELGLIPGDIFFDTAWQIFEEGVRNTIFNKVNKILAINLTQEQIFELVEVYRSHYPTIKPFEKVKYLLESLIQRGRCVALISDGPHKTQQSKLAALGLATYFKQIIFTEAYGTDWRKPSCLAFSEVMRKLEAKGENCIYIADNPRKDFIGPNLLGWKTIRLCSKAGIYYSETPVTGGEPNKTVYNYEELCDFLL